MFTFKDCPQTIHTTLNLLLTLLFSVCYSSVLFCFLFFLLSSLFAPKTHWLHHCVTDVCQLLFSPSFLLVSSRRNKTQSTNAICSGAQLIYVGACAPVKVVSGQADGCKTLGAP